MAATTCPECEKQYDPESVNRVTPIPDNTCSHCFNLLTAEEIAAAMERHGVKPRGPQEFVFEGN